MKVNIIGAVVSKDAECQREYMPTYSNYWEAKHNLLECAINAMSKFLVSNETQYYWCSVVKRCQREPPTYSNYN